MMRSSVPHTLNRSGQHKRKDGLKPSNRSRKKSRGGDYAITILDPVCIPVNATIRRRKVSLSDLPDLTNKENIHFLSTPCRSGRNLKKYIRIPTTLLLNDIRSALPSLSATGHSIFETLPTESMLHIFSFITDRKDILSLRNCSRACNTLLGDKFLRRQYYSEDLDHENELFYKIPCDYITSVQEGLTPAMRAVLIEWLIEVADEFSFQPETLFACVNHIDRFLSVSRVPKSRLQLLGSTAMLVASKYEEVRVPRVEDFVILSDNLYNKIEILAMETCLLTTLGFYMSAVTPRTFLPKYLSFISYTLTDTRISHLSNFVLELAILDYPASRMTASLVAASALCIALHILGYSAWTHLLEITTQCSLNDLEMQSCVDYLYGLLAQSRSARYVHEKYCHNDFSAVAVLPRPAWPPRAVSQALLASSALC